jgi:DNA-binding IclR family transcriptional regulator
MSLVAEVIAMKSHDGSTWWSGVSHHTRRNAAKSAIRALDVLEYFGLQSRPLRACEISRVFGLSPSSTDQMLKTLVDRAYLSFDPEKKHYFPSVRLLDFASMMSRHFGGERLRRLVTDLQTSTHTTVTLNVLCDVNIQIVDCMESTNFNGLKFGIDTVPGIVLLSQRPDDAIRKTVERAVLYRCCLMQNAARLISNSIAARARGFAIGDNTQLDITTISVPLRLNSNHVPLALTLTDKADRMHRQQKALLRTIQESIARALH